MTERRTNYNLEIIAGPCSAGPENIGELHQIADMGTVSGVRVVGLKSRTDLNPTGEGMGIDFDVINAQILQPGIERDILPPSVEYARDLSKRGMLVATEVMLPEIQIPYYEGLIPKDKLLLWNPSVNQLGWQTMQTAQYAERNGWAVGIKNGKALGSTLSEANDPNHEGTSMEKAWTGLAAYAQSANEIILIHRGVDVPEKGDYRNALVHESARRAKKKVPGSKLYFDPSHSYGPKLRDQIIEDTIRTMATRDGKGFLYDGILIETGTSKTDTNQHISLEELEAMTKELGTFRNLRTPEKVVFSSTSR